MSRTLFYARVRRGWGGCYFSSYLTPPIYHNTGGIGLEGDRRLLTYSDRGIKTKGVVVFLCLHEGIGLSRFDGTSNTNLKQTKKIDSGDHINVKNPY